MRLRIFPYKLGSVSAKALANELGVKRIRPTGFYRPKNRHQTIINWGSTHCPNYNANVLNRASSVVVASNKLLTLQALKVAGLPVPLFTTDRNVALDWVEEGKRVIARQKLCASSGIGIVICDEDNETVPYAPLYTQYFKKDKEFRIHVFQGQIIDYAEKRKRLGQERSSASKFIRTHTNGWVFCKDGVVVPESIKQACIKALQVLNMDFGALDVVSKDGKFVILEVNSAPGICGSTLQAYKNAMRKYL
jgi:glutathione synthase/RimK-type ligase-like ATP-grasp enzyme